VDYVAGERKGITTRLFLKIGRGTIGKFKPVKRYAIFFFDRAVFRSWRTVINP
jgi:hypothetical protein